MSTASVDADAPAGGLTGLDWFVIVAALCTLIAAAVWLVQGGQLPGGAPATPPASE